MHTHLELLVPGQHRGERRRRAVAQAVVAELDGLQRHACGGKPISNALLQAAFWLYVVGCVMALVLIFYKGYHVVGHVQAGNYDLADIHARMFGGSRALRAISHAVSHTVLAAGMGIFGWAFWQSSGTLRAAPTTD